MSLEKMMLRLFRLSPAADVHRVYTFLESLTVFGRPLRLLKWVSLDYHVDWPMWLRRPVLQVINHSCIAFGVVRRGVSERSILLVREFDYRMFAAFSVVLWPWRKRIVLNMNFAPPFPGEHSPLNLAAFRFLVRAGYTFMLFEGDAVRQDIERVYPGIKLLCPRFVVDDSNPQRAHLTAEGTFKIGFVGAFMRDKGGYPALIAAIRQLLDLPGITIRIGIRDSRRLNEFPEDIVSRVQFVDTALEDDYEHFIRTCDVIVTLAERLAYYRRHSAIILDCISARTLVVCPDYPLFAEEVGFPAPVGELYDGLEDLARAVKAACMNAAALCKNHDIYFARRTKADVADCIEAGMRESAIIDTHRQA